MSNTAAMLEVLVGHEQIAWVKHPSWPDHPDHDTAMRLMPKGQGSISACGIKGGRDAGRAFIESVQLASPLANVGDAKTLVLHPCSTPPSHLTTEAMASARRTAECIPRSGGWEHPTAISDAHTHARRAEGTVWPEYRRRQWPREPGGDPCPAACR